MRCRVGGAEVDFEAAPGEFGGNGGGVPQFSVGREI
jgi:hypothetical protein